MLDVLAGVAGVLFLVFGALVVPTVVLATVAVPLCARWLDPARNDETRP